MPDDVAFDATTIKSVAVSGYKSLFNESSIEVRPLTILCGANSSGKSSIMQPTLLLKQTLEATYDAGALLLNGPNVKFTSSGQFLSRAGDNRPTSFAALVEVGGKRFVRLHFKKQRIGMSVEQMDYSNGGAEATLKPSMPEEEIMRTLDARELNMVKGLRDQFKQVDPEWRIVRNRCFLQAQLGYRGSATAFLTGFNTTPSTLIEHSLRECIYLPGLRGNPERNYPVTAVGKTFPGPFQEYAASVIAQWQSEKNADKLEALRFDLERLGLTSRIVASSIADTQVELRVGRLERRGQTGTGGLVNIADVGLGVSQTLPVLVAIHTAAAGQLVYLEQPEIHLHPLAQSRIAQTFAAAAKRGVRLVVETHSSLILLGIQTLVAQGFLDKDLVKLHWFSRNSDGATEIRSADLEDDGSFGKWPEDFAEVSLNLENSFLTAAESKLLQKKSSTC
jgi:hypothetical protein